MPIYQYKCPKCLLEEEVISSMSDIGKARFHCGEVMERIWCIPKIIMKQSGNDMALNALNDRDTKYMKPEQKQMAVQGLEKPNKVFY